MPRFTIRDVMLYTFVVGSLLGIWLNLLQIQKLARKARDEAEARAVNPK